MRTRRFFAILVLSLFLAWQLTAPAALAGVLFGAVTVRDEIEMGRTFHEMVKAKLPVVDDPEVVAYVKDVVERVGKAMPPQPFSITTTVIDNNALNAFAVPGGYVYVFTGLLLNLEHESQLASVVGHELAHVTQRHVATRLEQMRVLGIGAMLGTIAGIFLGTKAGGGESMSNLGKAVAIGAQGAATAAFLSYSQDNEREADQVGMNYLIGAGYNPASMPQVFEIMAKRRWYTGSSDIPPYLSTHPGLLERVSYLGDRLKRLPSEYLDRADDDKKFLRVQTLLRGRLSDTDTALAYYKNKPEKELTCLDHVGLGILHGRQNRMAQAEQSFDKALACGGSDSLVLREAGSFYFRQGDFKRAGPLLQKALFYNPKDALALFYIARLMGERKEYPAAIQTMRQVLKEVPEDAEVRQHLGRLLGESGDTFGAHVQLAYAAMYERNPRQSGFHLDKARALAKTPEQKKELAELEKAHVARHARPDAPARPEGGGRP